MNTRFDPEEPRSGHPNPIGSPVEEPLTPTEARQGRLGRPVLKILVTALILAFLAWGAAEWWGQQTAPPAEQTATPPAGSNEPPKPDQPAPPSNTP